MEGAPTKPAQSGAGGADAAVKGRTPDFFIVGHQKCGTTALYLMLSEHPQIFMPQVKEPWFFARELRPGSPQAGTPSRPNQLEQYLALFAGAAPGQLIGEASPQYLRSSTAAASIAELRADARIVAILREPASFLRSLHQQLVATHDESERGFARAIELEPLRREGKHIPRRAVSPPSLLYSEHVRYVDQLRRLYDAFAPEQILVLIYDDFREDNLRTVRQVLDFLGADSGVPIEQVETAQLNAVRFMTLHRLRRRIRRMGLHPSAGGPVANAIDALTPGRRGSAAISAAFRRAVYTPPQPPDGELMLTLRKRFKGEVEAASEYLGRDLVTLWGYDRIS